MQPYVVSLTDVSDRVDGIKSSVDCRSGGAVDEKGEVSLALVSDDQLLQLLGNHPAPEIKQSIGKTNNAWHLA